ncbi:MAG: bifunctional DNA primase/polymerase [Chloroflexi bacterium]|nr:bifunctional DNA primase/polymerase [Chloroflexota bacterium]
MTTATDDRRQTTDERQTRTGADLLQTALWYAKAGWSVFPLKPGEKTPVTAHGLKDATTDADTIRGWWAKWPDANIGLNCGASGLVVVDFDVHKESYGGGPLLKQLRAEHPTTTAKTGTGGFHLLYQQPEDNPLGNGRGALPTGVDVRGVGGYIVVAPSIHPNGNRYGWEVEPHQTPPQALPGFLLAMLTKTPTAAKPPQRAGGYSFTDDLTRAAANLKRLRPGRADDYQTWVEVGMALSALGETGLGLWDDWSRQSGKYAPGGCEKKWRSFTPGDGLGLGSLARWADEDDPPAGAKQRPPSGGPALYVNGNGPGECIPQTALESLLDGLAAIGDDREDLTFYALDSVPQLAELDAAGFARFCAQLVSCGIPSEWVRRELRPAVNAVKKNQNNGKTWTDYVEAAAALGYTFRLNDLNDTLEVNGERLTDVHDATLLSLLHAQGLRNADVARRAFKTEAAKRRFHPVKEYLAGLKWDGQEQIGKLAGYFTDGHDPITYHDGTERTAFHAFLRRWLVGAVAKVYDPMNAQNPMLIVDGMQGSGKSWFAKWICPLPGFQYKGPIRPDDKDYSARLTTHWIWEVSELGATLRKADREALKAFITQQDYTYRPVYGRMDLVKPALASFIGTVNFEGALLADPTGHRRFWPVKLTRLDWGYSRAVDVNQLWAQAFALYRGGEAWRLTPEERAAHAAIVETYEVEDVLAGYIQEYFQIEPDNGNLYTHTTAIIDTLRTFAGMKGNDKSLAMQLSTSLTGLGLRKEKRRDVGGNLRWGYAGITRPPQE